MKLTNVSNLKKAIDTLNELATRTFWVETEFNVEVLDTALVITFEDDSLEFEMLNFFKETSFECRKERDGRFTFTVEL
jgi:hypothetical protein